MAIPAARAARAPAQQGLSALIGAIGEERFGACVAAYLHDLCGAHHFAAFRIGDDGPVPVAASSLDPVRSNAAMVDRYLRQQWWRRDPAMTQARLRRDERAISVIRLDLGDLRFAELRTHVYPDIRDRLLVCGRHEGIDFGLSVLRARPHDAFAAGGVERLTDLADVVISAVAKDLAVRSAAPDPAAALACVREIERCITCGAALPRREAEVCARVLRGLSSAGIALDLGIGEESVKTYRKRAYQRLGLSSERELLTWYLALWSSWRASCGDGRAVSLTGGSAAH